MAVAHHRRVRPVLEHVRRVLANGLQHEEPPRVRLAKQTLVDQRADGVEVCVADGFGGVELEARGEDCKASEELFLRVGQQVIAPLDR